MYIFILSLIKSNFRLNVHINAMQVECNKLLTETAQFSSLNEFRTNLECMLIVLRSLIYNYLVERRSNDLYYI